MVSSEHLILQLRCRLFSGIDRKWNRIDSPCDKERNDGRKVAALYGILSKCAACMGQTWPVFTVKSSYLKDRVLVHGKTDTVSSELVKNIM
jgi:hypothetical protein